MDCAVNGMLVLGRIAGNGAGDGDLPPLIPVVAASRGEPAAADEKDDLLDPGMLAGGFMLERGVEGNGVPDDPEVCIGSEPKVSGSSEANVTTDPASEAVDALRPMEGRRVLKDGGLELLISMFMCDPARPARSRTKGLTVKVLFR